MNYNEDFIFRGNPYPPFPNHSLNGNDIVSLAAYLECNIGEGPFIDSSDGVISIDFVSQGADEFEDPKGTKTNLARYTLLVIKCNLKNQN